ncbi:MAG: 30S ribosomal protein S15 [Planctomycetes bacterium]|nr:30S ribosomal protein S15 [Planctomycetota bacterium]
MTTAAKTARIAESRTHASDTGSSAVQVSLLTDRINALTEHLKTHRRDNSTRRGLLKLVGQRNRLLRYMQRTDVKAYEALNERLGIRGVKSGA